MSCASAVALHIFILGPKLEKQLYLEHDPLRAEEKYGGIMRWPIHFYSELDQAISTHISLTKTKPSLMALG